MKAESNILKGVVVTLLGVLGGTVVTAYSMGLEKATITQNIERNKTEVDDLKKLITDQLLIFNGHLDQINSSMQIQAIAIGEIKGDVKTLQAIVEIMQNKK